MNNIISLETNRLILRPISIKEHLSLRYVDWLNDPLIYKYLEIQGEYTMDSLNTFLQYIIANNIFMWGIHTKGENKHIGNIKIDPVNLKHGYGEYGIMLGDRSEWKKGFAKEASAAVIKYFFSPPFNLRKINLGVLKGNNSAHQMYKNLGFIEEGIYKYHIKQGNVYYDVIRMAIFNSSFCYDK